MSNTTREKLAHILHISGVSEDFYKALVDRDRPLLDPERILADAILAALPDIVRGMITPLVWEHSTHIKHDGCVEYAETQAGTYFIMYDNDDFKGYYCDFVHLGNCTWFGTGGANSTEVISGVHDDDLAPIKVAANDHHAAQIRAAIEWDKGGLE